MRQRRGAAGSRAVQTLVLWAATGPSGGCHSRSAQHWPDGLHGWEGYVVGVDVDVDVSCLCQYALCTNMNILPELGGSGLRASWHARSGLPVGPANDWPSVWPATQHLDRLRTSHHCALCTASLRVLVVRRASTPSAHHAFLNPQAKTPPCSPANEHAIARLRFHSLTRADTAPLSHLDLKSLSRFGYIPVELCHTFDSTTYILPSPGLGARVGPAVRTLSPFMNPGAPSTASNNAAAKPIRFVVNHDGPYAKRRRINSACLTCRKKKTRCSGTI